LFATKGNLVVMNKLYHKIAVASACTALSFTLLANKEAKAATFNLTATQFSISAETLPYLSDVRFSLYEYVYASNYLLPPYTDYSSVGVGKAETRQFYEFNIASLFLATNTVISRAVLDTPVDKVRTNYSYVNLDLYGYVGNGKPDINDFNAGEFLGSQNALNRYPFHQAEFEVTNFVSQLISNGNSFAGFGFRAGIPSLQSSRAQGGGLAILSYGGKQPTLIIETVDVPEPVNVPEPTTIFGSALALGVGGWLKRKKSGQQNKTTSQH
jgi:hypothetical protein